MKVLKYFPVAEAELSVWGVSATRRLAPALGRIPLKTALVRRRIDTVGGYDGEVRRLGSGKVWRSRGALTPQTDSSALLENKRIKDCSKLLCSAGIDYAVHSLGDGGINIVFAVINEDALLRFEVVS